MNFEDEPYTRLYIRRTATNRRLGWEGRALMHELHYELDRAGILELNGEPVETLALITGIPERIVRVGWDRLLKTETVLLRGHTVVWPKWLEAQTATRSDAARQRDSRARRRDIAKASGEPQVRLVYFIRAGDGPIKIGFTTDLPGRLSQLQTSHAVTLEVLAVIHDADESVEDELHEHFDHLRERGEWFKPEQELLDIVELVRSGAPLVTVRHELSRKVTLNSADPSSADPSKKKKPATSRVRGERPRPRADLLHAHIEIADYVPLACHWEYAAELGLSRDQAEGALRDLRDKHGAKRHTAPWLDDKLSTFIETAAQSGGGRRGRGPVQPTPAGVTGWEGATDAND